MNAVRSDSRRATKLRRAAAMASRATGPIFTLSPANATLRKLSSVKSARRFATTVIPVSPGMFPGTYAICSGGFSGLHRIPQEELALSGRVRAGHAILRGAQVVVEVGEDNRCLVEQQGFDLLGQLALRGQDHRANEVPGELVVGGVVEVGRVPGALPLLAVDGRRRSREVHVRNCSGTVVDQAHLTVEPVGLPEHGRAVVLGRRLDRQGDIHADLAGRLLD